MPLCFRKDDQSFLGSSQFHMFKAPFYKRLSLYLLPVTLVGARILRYFVNFWVFSSDHIRDLIKIA